MINVGMTVREAVLLASKCDDYGGDEGRGLRDRIIKAIELATGNEKLLVVCCAVNHDDQFWNHKIAAIKSLRLATGWGLKESKEWVESCQYDSKTNHSPPLDPSSAQKLCEELKKCGMDCWTTNA